MDKIEQYETIQEHNEDQTRSPESIPNTAEGAENMVEVIISIPANTALMEVTVTSVGEGGELSARKGKFDVEQIVMSRMRYLQLIEGTQKNTEQGEGSKDQQTDDNAEA